MADNQTPPVPHFDRMIRDILRWNTVLVVALVIVGFALTQSAKLVLGLLSGAILATANALLLARKLKKITSMSDPRSGQLSMVAGMGVRFLVMGAGMALAVILFQLYKDVYGMAGLLGAILIFQFVSGWFATRSMAPRKDGD